MIVASTSVAGPVAVLHQSPRSGDRMQVPLERILAPVLGADYSRFGAEMAIAIGKGCGATITTLHVSTPPTENEVLRHSNQLLRTGRVIFADIIALGRREGVRVMLKAMISPAKEHAILRQAIIGNYQLIVIGAKTRMGDQFHFGDIAGAIIKKAP